MFGLHMGRMGGTGRVGGAPIWTPADIFTGGEKGVVLDWTRVAGLYQDDTAATPVTAATQPIGYTLDLSPNAVAAKQATAAKRPTFSGIPKTLGIDLVANGRFATDTLWAKGAGWSIAAGAAAKVAGAASNLTQNVAVVAGQTYMLHFGCSRTSGTVKIALTGGTAVSGYAANYSGSYPEFFVANAGNVTVELQADAAFAGTVNNVSVRPVTEFSVMGAHFDGANDLLQTAAVNMSSSQQATIFIASRYGENAGNATPFEAGNYYGGLAGSVAAIFSAAPTGRLRGATGTNDVGTTEGPPIFSPSSMVSAYEIDLSQATPAQQMVVHTRGIVPTQTVSSDAGGGNLFNGVITIGSATNEFLLWKNLIHRFLIINRKLTPTEFAAAEKWTRQGQAYVAVIGDSTLAGNGSSDGLPFNRSVVSFAGGLIAGKADVSAAGEKIAGQKTRWNNIAQKEALQAVIIQVGLNDINTYIGVSKTTTQIIADLQDLVNTVNAAKPAGCKTYISALTPCRGWVGVSSGQTAAAYQAWLDVNAAISGGGAAPIINVDGRITSHVAALSDGDGYLHPMFDGNNDHVHESAEGRFIVANAWRERLAADGLLP